MNKKKLILAVVALAVVAAAFAGIWLATRPETQVGEKTITVTVVHKDESQVVKTYHTDEEYLDKVLLTEGLITGTEGQYGLVVETVDGERADWTVDNAFWNIFIGEEAATTGISGVVVQDGGSYSLVYTPLS